MCARGQGLGGIIQKERCQDFLKFLLNYVSLDIRLSNQELVFVFILSVISYALFITLFVGLFVYNYCSVPLPTFL